MKRLTRAGRLVALAGMFLFTASTLPVGATGRTVRPPSPPSPPSTAPAALRATSSDTRVTLTWGAVAGAKAYYVYRSADGTFDSTPTATAWGTTFRESGLATGQAYSYKVAAFSRGGVGPESATVRIAVIATPADVTAVRGDRQVTLAWTPSAGAARYVVYRKASGQHTFAEIASVAAPPYVNPNLTNGTKYYYRVKALADTASSALSATVWATPQPPPPATAPGNLAAAAGNGRVTLTWAPVAGATKYRVWRSTDSAADGLALGSITTTTFKDYKVTNGTTYHYRVAAANPGGDGPLSNAVAATPMDKPVAPTGLTATAGNAVVTLSWNAVPGADGYRVYRATRSGRQGTTPLVATITTPAYVDNTVTNGPTYYYRVTAFNVGGESPRSAEASASPEAPAPGTDLDVLGAFRFLRQSTWGPKPGDAERVRALGVEAFLTEQFSAPASIYPDTLFAQSVEWTQEHFMHLALTGPDQLRQRMAWALHKIWVVSANDINNAAGMVTYQRILMQYAFGNYRDLMRDMTLNPAMGRYLNMVNNKSQQVTGTPANENYAREVLQLFTTGIPRLNPDGTVVRDASGQEVPVYTETDVKELARVFTGWTYGDGNPATVPTRLGRENFKVPMEPVERYHDTGEKVVLGQTFPAGQTTRQDLEQAIDLVFQHPNVGPFVSRQLIQQFVTSNPSPGYVQAVASVFADDGTGERGDLAAVIRAVLTHPEASLSSPDTGKLAEPALFVIGFMRALNADVADHPFMSDKVEEMGQKIFYPPSVFSYYSPGFRVRGTTGPDGLPLVGPEFQILTSVTALVRVNFVAAVLGNWYSNDVTIDYAPFTALAGDPAALVDACARLLMGTRIANDHRAAIIAAVRAAPSASALERARTALYLTMVAAQAQIDW